MARRQPYHYGNANQSPYTGDQTVPNLHANDDLAEELVPKVSLLKSLALDMGEEIRSHRSLLSSIDDEFDGTWGRLTNSMSKVKMLASSGHNRWYLYMILFAAFVFLFIWIIR